MFRRNGLPDFLFEQDNEQEEEALLLVLLISPPPSSSSSPLIPLVSSSLRDVSPQKLLLDMSIYAST